MANRISTESLYKITQSLADKAVSDVKKRREDEKKREEAVKKNREERLAAAAEQNKIPNYKGGSLWDQYKAALASGEAKNASDFITKRDTRNAAWNKVGAETLNDDMEALAKSISSTYGTQFDPSKYYSQETINGSADQVRKMRDRLNALAEYYNAYGGSDEQKQAVGEQIKAYDSELKFLGDLGTHYGQYKNEADFNYRTDRRRDEDYIVNDYDAEAGKKNLDELKSYLDRMPENKNRYRMIGDRLFGNNGEKVLEEARKRYGLDGMTDDEVKNWLTQEYQLESFALNNVDRMRTAAGYRNLANNEDFLQGVISGKAVENPTFEDYLNYENEMFRLAEKVNSGVATKEEQQQYAELSENAPTVNNRFRFLEDAQSGKYGGQGYEQNSTYSGLDKALLNSKQYHYEQMTDDEKRVYYYLLGTQGADAADRYLDDLKTTLDYRNTEEVKQYIRDLKDSKIFGNVSAAALANTFGGLGGAALGYLIADSNEGINKTAGDIAYSAASVPLNVLGGGISTIGEIGQRLDLVSKGDWEGKGYNPYGNYNLLSVAGREARGLVAKDIEDKVGWEMFGQNVMSQVYQSLMSGADSAFGMATLGKLYTISMGGSAAASKAAELYESGASSSQIYWESLLSGIAEATFEYLSMENLSSIESILKSKPHLPRDVFKKILVQNGVEASEEIFTEIADIIIDKGIKKYDSDYDRKVTEYVRDGMTREEAVRKAASEVAADIGWAGAGGFISGLTSSTLRITAAYRAGNAGTDAQIASIDPGNAEGLFNNAKNIDYSILNDAADALKKGDTEGAAEILSDGEGWYKRLKLYTNKKYGKNQASEISANIDASIDNLNQIKNLISSGDINADSIQAVLEKARSAQETEVDVTSGNDEKLFSLLAKGELSNSVIEKNILKDKGTLAAFERLTGLKAEGATVSQKRASVRKALEAVNQSSETLKAAQSAIESGTTATEGHKNAAIIIDQAIQANRAENSRLRNSEKVKSAETKAAIDSTNRQHRFLQTVRNYVINGGDLSGFTEMSVANVSDEGGTNSSEAKTSQGTAKKRVKADFSAYQNEKYSAEYAERLAQRVSKTVQDDEFKKMNAKIEQDIRNVEESESMTTEEKEQEIGELKEKLERNYALEKALDDFREMGRIVRAGEVDKVTESLRKPLKKLGININVVDDIKAAEGYKSGAYFDKKTNTINVSRNWNGVEGIVKLELSDDGKSFVLSTEGVSFERAVTERIAHEIAHADSGLTMDFIKAVAGTQYDAFDLKGRLEHPNDRSWKSEDAQKEKNWQKFVEPYTEQAMLDMEGTEEQKRASAEKVVNDAYIFEEIMAEMFGGAVDDMGHSTSAGENIFWAMNRNKPGIIKRIVNALERFIARIRGKDAYLVVEQKQAAERLRDMLTGELKRAYGTDVKGEAAVESGGGKRYSITSDGKVSETASDDTSSIKEQLRNSLDTVNALESVASVEYSPTNKKELKDRAISEFRKIGFVVDRQNFGKIEIGEKQIANSLNYLNTEAEKAALLTVPKVLKRGEIISGHKDHKGRAYSTITIAAPVEINGVRGNVAATVRQTGVSRYYTHRILLPNGSEFIFAESRKNEEPTFVGMPAANDSQRSTISSSSANSISQADGNVNRKFSEISDAKMIEETAERLNEVSKPEKRFSLSSNVEQTKDLIAVHNMTAAELEKSLDLGGFPMPSIAIIKAADGHSKYGDTSIVFGKDTIDPKKSVRNKVYGGDAWTPTFPKIDYKANEKVGKRIRDKYYDLSRKYGYDNTRALYNYAQDLSDVLTSKGGEKAMIEKLHSDTGMMQIYLMDTGRERVANVNKETKTALTDGQVRQYENLIETLGRDEMNGFARKDGGELSDLIRRRKAFIEENEAGIRKAFEKTFIESGMSAKDAAEVSAELALSDLRKYVLDTFNYIKNGAETVKTEFDSEATDAAIKKAADGEDYRKWINNLFGGAEEKSGIRNSKDAYTASGNRRSFEALHWENNLENIVKAMLEQEETGGAFFSGTGIWGVSAKKYNSISEIKNDSSRLRIMNEAEYNALKEQYGARMQEIAQTLIDPRNDNYFIASDDAYSLIVDAVRNSKDESGILRYLKKYNSKATEKTASDIAALVRDIAEMPTGYFEAKPQRAVGFDEVKAVILPDNASGELISRLESDGINTVTYKAGDENSRLEALNGVRDVRFSLTRANDEYMKAVESGDTEEQRRLVDEAAKESGYDRLFWHGSKKGGGFTEFRDWSYFTENKKYASRYAKAGDKGSLYEVYANLGNAFDTRKPECREIFDKMRSEYRLSDVQESGLPDWTDGYDIADFIDENGLDYDSIILDEGGDLVDGKPVSRGLSYVIRSSEQVKSADPITYDDSGNVIPLTERFDSGNRDIRWSLAGKYDYSKSFADQIDDYKNGLLPVYDTFVVSETPKVWQDIGFNALPVTLNQTHVDYALNGTKDADHEVSEADLKKLPEKIKEPIAIIQSQSNPSRAVVFIEMTSKSGKNIVVPVEVDGYGTTNSITIDSNALASMFGKKNAPKQLKNAIDNTINGKTELFYWDKKRSLALLHLAGLQLPGNLPQDGFVHSIREPGSFVKAKMDNVTNSLQFKRWFGDWNGGKRNVSKVVNRDGSPRIVYHYTDTNFEAFDTSKSGSNQGTTLGDGIYVSTNPTEFSYAGKNRLELYASIKNPFEKQLTKSQAERIYDKYFAPYHDDKYNTYRPHVIKQLQSRLSVFNYLSEAAENGGVRTSDILKELGYDGVHDGSEWVAFDSTQLKSATDNIGTFDKDNPKFRYSLVKSAQSELKALQKENEKLRQDVDDLKQEMQLTHGRKLSRDALINSIQKILIDRYDVKLSAKELYPHVTNLFDMLYNNTVDGKRLKKGERVDTMRIIEEMDKIVDAVIENAVGVDDTYVEMKNLLPELRKTKLVVPMDARADAAQSAGYENWADFRKANFGKVGFANEETPIDTYYMELSERYPELFPDGITHPGEMAAQIADVVNTIRESGITEYQLYDAEDERIRVSIKNDVMDIIRNAEKLQTFADRAAQKVEDTKLAEAMHYGADIAKLKRLNAEKVAGIRAENQKRLSDMRRKYQNRVASVREKYAEARANRSEKQKQTVLRNKVLRKYTEASTKLDRPTTENHITEAMRKPLMEFLAAVDITTGKSMAKQGVYDRILKVISDAQREAAGIESNSGLKIEETDLNVQERELIDRSGILDRMRNWVEANKGKKLTELSSAQLTELNGIFNQLTHVMAEIKRLYDPRDGLAAKSWQAQKEIGLAQTKERKQVMTEKGAKYRDAKENVGMGAYDANNFFNMLGSDVMNEVHDRLRVRQRKAAENVDMFVNEMADATGGEISKKWHGKDADIITLNLSRGKVQMIPSQLITAYLMLNQKDSRNCLFDDAGGAVIGKFTAKLTTQNNDSKNLLTKLKNLVRESYVFESGEKFIMNEADEAKIISAMNEYDPKLITVADKISSILNGSAARLGNEVSMAMYGYKKFTTENYFPMRTTDDYRAIAVDPSYEVKNLLGISLAQERTHRSGKPLVIEDVFDVVGRHLTNMAQYNAFAQEIDNIRKMYTIRLGNGTSLKQRMIRAYGKGADEYFVKLLSNLSGPQVSSRNAAESVSAKLTSRYKAAAVAGNLSVTLKQPMSIFRALPEFTSAGLKEIISLKEDLTNLRPKNLDKSIQEMLKYSGIAKMKNWGSSENITKKSFEELYNKNAITKGRRFNEWLTSGAENADMWTWAKLWRMSKAEIDAQGKYTVGSKEYFEAVDRKFSDVIGKTQVVQSALDSSMAVQNANVIQGMLYAFQNEPLKQFNYLSSVIRDARRGKPGAKAKLAKTIISSAANTIAVSAISTAMSLLRGTLDRDDDDELWDDILKSFGENVLADVLSGGLAPIWWVIEGFGSAVFSGRFGNVIERLDTAALTDLGDLINKYFIKHSQGGFNLGTVQDIVNVASNLFGLPAKNIFRDVKGAVDRIIFDTGWFSPMDEYNYLKLWKDVELTDKSAVTEAYYDVLRDAVDRKKYSDYVKIKRDMIYHGYTETKIKNAVMKSSVMDDLYELKKSNPGSYKAKVNSIVSSVSAVSSLEGKEMEDFIESAMKRREREDGGSKTDEEVYDEMHKKMEKEVKEQLIYIDVSKRAAYIKKMLKTYGEYGITEADILKVLRKAGKA